MEPGEINIEEVLKKWEKHHPPPERRMNDEKPWYQQPVSEYSNSNQKRRRRMLKKSTPDYINEGHHIQNRFRVIPPVIESNIQKYEISQCTKCKNMLQQFPVQTNEAKNSQTLSLFECAAAKKHLNWFELNFLQKSLLNACYKSKDEHSLKDVVLKDLPVLFVHNVPGGVFGSVLLHLFCAALSGKLPRSLINESNITSPFMKNFMEKLGFIFPADNNDHDGNDNDCNDNKSKVDVIVNLLKSGHHVFVQLDEHELSTSLTDRFFPSLLNSLRSDDDELLKRLLLVPVSLSIETTEDLFTSNFSVTSLLKDFFFYTTVAQQEKSLSYFNVSQGVKVQSLMLLASELNEQEGTDEENNLVMRHVSFDLLGLGAILPTHIVSFLLITKYRDSVSIDILVDSVDWLTAELQSAGRFFGFIGDTAVITNHALQILRSDDVIRIYDDTKVVTLNDDHHSMQKLFKNAKKIINTFVTKSVLAKSVIACLGGQLELSAGSGYNVTCRNGQLLEKAEYLAEMLTFLFDFCCPFNKISEELVDALEKLVTIDILCTSSDTYENQTHEKLIRSIAIDSVFDQNDGEDDGYGHNTNGESEITYNVNLQEESVVELLDFFSSCTSPFVEIIFIVVALIRETESGVVITVDKIYDSVLERLQNGFFMYGEMVTKNFISRIFDLLYEKEVIDEYQEGFQLSNYYSNGDGEMENFLVEIALFR